MVKISKKLINYGVFTILLLFLIYNSVYFEDLETRTQIQASQQFDTVEFVQEFWYKGLLPNLAQSTSATKLILGLNTDITKTGQKYGRKLGLASTYYFLLHGEGRIVDITEEGIVLSLVSSQNIPDIIIATNFIFGNAIRDASGLIDVSDFPSSMEFNTISSEINKVVSRDVIPSFIDKVEIGGDLLFFGATEVNKDEPEINPLKVIPIQVQVYD
jgi:predicted lipoprotein